METSGKLLKVSVGEINQKVNGALILNFLSGGLGYRNDIARFFKD
jgi:hypothetical protein